MKKLLEKDIITEINKVFSVTDRLFAMWMNGYTAIRKVYYRGYYTFLQIYDCKLNLQTAIAGSGSDNFP